VAKTIFQKEGEAEMPLPAGDNSEKGAVLHVEGSDIHGAHSADGIFFAEDEEWRTEVQGVIVERNKGSFCKGEDEVTH